VRDIVRAVGNPLGLRSSVTQGIVSSLGRTLGEGANGLSLPAAIQASAAIDPGNSGGALVDVAGRVVGSRRSRPPIPSWAAPTPRYRIRDPRQRRDFDRPPGAGTGR
jgi:hypothetical protein